MNKVKRSWLGQEFVEEFGEAAYDLLIATAWKHDSKRFDLAMKKAAASGPLGYDHFSAALHIIEKHGCLKSLGDLHHFGKVFDRESVYHWLHADPARRAWSVVFNPYKSFYEPGNQDNEVVDFVGGLHTYDGIAAQGAEIAKRTGIPGFVFSWPTGGVVKKAPAEWIELVAAKHAVAIAAQKKKINTAMTPKQAENDKAVLLANQIIDEMLAEKASALPKWMPDAQ